MGIKNILRSPRYRVAASVGLVSLLVYLPALRNGFVEWDDTEYVVENPHIRSLSVGFVEWAFTTFRAANWHPLTWISHALDYAVWGLNPMGHHLTNILLHGLNTFLVVVLVARLVETACARQCAGGDSQQAIKTRENELRNAPSGAYPATSAAYSRFALVAAGVTGLLFGIHPIHVESVAWVAERKDLLCAFFYLLSVLMYARYAAAVSMQGAKDIGHNQKDTTQGSAHRGESAVYSIRHALGPMLSALCFFVLALLSKPMAVSLPFVLLILDWYPFDRILSVRSFLSACIEKIPFFLLSIASSVLTVLAQHGPMERLEPVALPVRLLVAASSLLSYLWKTVLPLTLIPYYPYPRSASLSSPEYLAAAFVVVGISGAAVLAAKRDRIWLAIWCYYLITLAPVLGIIRVGGQAMADRYTYLPGIGPLLLTGVAAAWIMQKFALARRRILLSSVLAGIFLLVIVPMSALTLRQIGIWRDSITLWSDVIEKQDGKVIMAYKNRGIAFEKMGRPDLAMEDYNSAIALSPSYYQAYQSRGGLFQKAGRTDMAIADFTKAIALNPSYYEAYHSLGMLYGSSGDLAKALEYFDMTISIAPGYPQAYNNRGYVYSLMGMKSKALEDFNKAISLDRTYAQFYVNRGNLYLAMGVSDLANADFRTACSMGHEGGCNALRMNTH